MDELVYPRERTQYSLPPVDAPTRRLQQSARWLIFAVDGSAPRAPAATFRRPLPQGKTYGQIEGRRPAAGLFRVGDDAGAR